MHPFPPLSVGACTLAHPPLFHEQLEEIEVDRNPDGFAGIFESNICDDGVDAQESFFGTRSYLKLDGISTNPDFDLSIIIMNLTEYASTWPRLKHVRTPPNPGNPWGVQPAGYLSNGRKSGTAASGDLIQLNLCANRMVKVKSCFVGFAQNTIG